MNRIHSGTFLKKHTDGKRHEKITQRCSIIKYNQNYDEMSPLHQLRYLINHTLLEDA